MEMKKVPSFPEALAQAPQEVVHCDRQCTIASHQKGVSLRKES